MARKPLSPGDRVGRYEIARHLAAGGMAEVYLARATGLGAFEKLVALKCLHPALDGRGSAVRMFLQEARLVATLDHPHVAQVFDVGQDDGLYFLVMEYVSGRDLRRVLGRARERGLAIPLGHALAIGVALASALHHAHERRDAGGRPLGVVHRDVSPSNVLLSWSGTVKLADFGIAKAADGGGLTRVGTIRGKLEYMSPEQCRGQALDRRSDLFSLGIVLYEVVTGRRPFAGEDDAALARAITEGEPAPPAEARPACPEALALILRRLLQKDPEARYPTARDLLGDLEGLAASSGLVPSSAHLGEFLRELFDRPDEAAEATSSLPRPADELVPATRTVEASRLAGRSTRRGITFVAAGLAVAAAVGASVLWHQRAPVARLPLVPSAPSPPAAPAAAPASPGEAAPAREAPPPPAPARTPKRARLRTPASRVDDQVQDDALFPGGRGGGRRRP